MSNSQSELQTLQGSCHCGALQFSFRTEPIVTAFRCNCSICRRKGATMSPDYIAPAQFLELKGLDNLQRYQFGDHLVFHYFCKTCGISPFHDGTENPGHYRVNLGCVDGLDLESLAITKIDGASF